MVRAWLAPGVPRYGAQHSTVQHPTLEDVRRELLRSHAVVVYTCTSAPKGEAKRARFPLHEARRSFLQGAWLYQVVWGAEARSAAEVTACRAAGRGAPGGSGSWVPARRSLCALAQ
jgi:hypothetical protein